MRYDKHHFVGYSVRLLVTLTTALICFAPSTFPAEIHDAAEHGDLETVKSLMSQDPQLLEVRDENGHTPYLCAAASGDIATARYLADLGADIRAVNNRGNNALALASYFGRPEMVTYLYEQGLDVNNVNVSGFTPFLYAAYMNRPEIVRFLAAHGADKDVCEQQNGGSAMHWACSRTDSSMCKLLLECGVAIDKSDCLDSTQPLMWACFSGNQGTMKFLLDRGINPNLCKANGWSSLHNAAMNGHVEAARLLIQYGARLDAATVRGLTPTMLSIQTGNTEMARFFLQQGADPHYVDTTSGNTLTHSAVMGGNTELLSMLLDMGAPIDTPNHQGDSPLDWAVSNGIVAAAELLLSRGASVNSTNAVGKSLLRTAIDQGQGEIFDLLIDHGVDPSTPDSLYGLTELHAAATTGNRHAVERLVDAGADINARDKQGHTPLFDAYKYGNQQAASVLKEAGAVGDAAELSGIAPPRFSDQIATGEAAVWYLGHCGFAVKTAHHLMIFDYWTRGASSDDPSLANGIIYPPEIASENVTVFVTHEHQDHYDPAIYTWPGDVPNIKYVYGFRPEDLPRHRESGYPGPAYTYLPPRTDTTLDGMRVTTIEANDAGVGFLIQVDGVTFYHAGDHAGWREGQEQAYKDEIDFLAGVVPAVDFSFLNVTGCHTGDTVALAEAVYYTLEKLHSTCWIPTHGLNREYIYKTFADKIRARGAASEAICPEHRGDHYLLKKGQRM